MRQRESGKRISKPTVAVKGLTLNLFEGQVFAFLGHTGSGKSSVVSMLMGLVRPTSGEAYVYSHRVTQAGEETCYQIMDALVCGIQDSPICHKGDAVCSPCVCANVLALFVRACDDILTPFTEVQNGCVHKVVRYEKVVGATW